MGWIVGRGGTINVSNTLYNTSQDPTLPSKIDLYNATIRTKNLENRANGEIYLKDQGKIESAIFTSTKDSKFYFIGSGSGFGSISGAQSITLDGEEFFQAGLLNT
uniref:hypothetical protein n=1 Tax=uncultured Helicobacter sp. TaxID=175537 RepID=UPI0026071A7C